MKTQNYSKLTSLLLMLLMQILVGCFGAKKGETAAKVQIFQGVAQLAVNYAEGGLILTGRNNHGDAFSRVVDTNNGEVELTLKNGTWVFSAMAWTNGTNYAFEGTTRCGITSPTVLSGSELNINLSLSNSTCDTAPFKGSGTMNGSPGSYKFPYPRFVNCQQIPAGAPGLSAGSAVAACDDTNIQTKRGHLGSYKVQVTSFDKMGGSFTARSGLLESRCVRVDSANPDFSAVASVDTSMTGINLSIPLGNGTIHLPFRIVGFYGTEDCDATSVNSRGSKAFEFNTGLADTSSDQSFNTNFDGASNVTWVYLRSQDSEVCSGSRLSAAPYAAGSGTRKHPFAICTATQFNAIGVNITNSYRIASSIDFNGGSFTPVGQTGTTPSGGLTGFFLGNNHTLSNINYSIPANNQYNGIIRYVQVGSLVNNLKVNGLSLSGDNTTAHNTGGLIGKVAAAVSVQVNNIFLKNVHIHGGDWVGGVVGFATGAILNNVHVIGEVKGASNVAGIVGKTDNALGSNNNISIASFKGNVISFGAYAGGIVAYVNSANIFEKLRSEGRIEADTHVGGLIGRLGLAGSTVQYSYSLASVFGRNTSPSYTGGLIGLGIASSTLKSSFHTVGTVVSYDTNYGGCLGSATSLTLPPTEDSYYSGNNNAQGCVGLTPGQIRDNSMTNELGTISGTVNGVDDWFKLATDDTYDFPQLMWEKELESTELPYLARACSGKYITQYGAGTQSNPYWVCNSSQFAGMNSNPTAYYVLKTNIDLQDQAVNNTSSLIASSPNVDGNNFRVTNLFVNYTSAAFGSMGYFGTLATGKTFKNVIFDHPIFNYSYSESSGVTYRDVGLIFATNSGSIEGVVINKALVTFAGAMSMQNATTVYHSKGILVGTNNPTGLVTKSFVSADIAHNTGTNSNSSPGDYLYLGGVVGSNAGTVEKTLGHINYKKSSAGYYHDYSYGSIVGSNAGTISKCASQGLTQNTISSGASPVTYNLGGITGWNSGTIVDTYSNTNYQMNANFAQPSNVGGLVGKNTGTSSIIRRSYYQQIGGAYNSFYTTGVTRGGIVGSYSNSSGAIYEDLFCYDGTPSGTRFGADAGLSNAYTNPTYTNVMDDGTNFACMTTGSSSYNSGTNDLDLTNGSNINFTTSSYWSMSDDPDSTSVWAHDSGVSEYVMLRDLWKY